MLIVVAQNCALPGVSITDLTVLPVTFDLIQPAAIPDFSPALVYEN